MARKVTANKSPQPQPLLAFQGELGAFSQTAARQLAGGNIRVLPCHRFEELYTNLRDGNVDAAVVPIENTLHGSVHENYDHLLRFELPIVAETQVRIVHNLIAPPGVRLDQIKKVYSHPVALTQCLDFFAANPGFERVPFYDTAGSVKMLIETGAKDSAAIASKVAAEIHGGRILTESIEDDRQNFTRFFLLQRPGDTRQLHHRPHPSAEWKTSLVFTTANVPGALFRALAAFSLRDLSLNKIESRPLRGKPWEYLFYLDFIGHIDDPKCHNAIANLAEVTDFQRVLGCYPRGV